MNCQRDQGASPPSAVAVTISPMRLKNESRKTRTRPLKARLAPVALSRFGCCRRCGS
jgi:hypothetical protein